MAPCRTSVAFTAVAALVLLAGIVVAFVRINSDGSSPPTDTAPGWAKQCIGADAGPITGDYDGMTTDQAQAVADRAGQHLLLGAKDGHCTSIFDNFVPNTITIAVQDGVVVYARGPYT